MNCKIGQSVGHFYQGGSARWCPSERKLASRKGVAGWRRGGGEGADRFLIIAAAGKDC